MSRKRKKNPAKTIEVDRFRLIGQVEEISEEEEAEELDAIEQEMAEDGDVLENIDPLSPLEEKELRELKKRVNESEKLAKQIEEFREELAKAQRQKEYSPPIQPWPKTTTGKWIYYTYDTNTTVTTDKITIPGITDTTANVEYYQPRDDLDDIGYDYDPQNVYTFESQTGNLVSLEVYKEPTTGLTHTFNTSEIRAPIIKSPL